MMSDLIPFGEWLPDRPPLGNDGVSIALNVLPEGKDYTPIKQLTANTSTLPGECKGAYSFITEAGTVETFAGTATGLYRAAGTTWLDVTRSSGGTYSVASDMYWHFINYGNRVIATNYTDTMQSFVVGTSTQFVNLSGTGTPPKAKSITVINNFVMVLNVVHPDDNVRGARLQWSGIDNPTYWADSTTSDTVDIQVQSDFQDVYGDYGLGSRIVNLKDYAVAVFERAIVRVHYVGAPLFFSVEVAEVKRGTRAPGSVVSNGQGVYYYAEDGFYMFDGVSSTPIGEQKVNKFFAADADPNKSHKIQGVADPKNNRIAWLYQSVNSVNDKPDKILFYSTVYQRFTLANVNAEVLVEGLTGSLTLENVGALYPNLETVPFSLDSRIWAGGNNLLSAFTHTHSLGVFEGVTAAATLETTEVRFNPEGMSLLTTVLPVIDTTACTVSVGARKLVSQSPSYGGDVATSSETGEADVFVENRYLRAKVSIPQGTTWTKAQGVMYRVAPAGKL